MRKKLFILIILLSLTACNKTAGECLKIYNYEVMHDKSWTYKSGSYGHYFETNQGIIYLNYTAKFIDSTEFSNHILEHLRFWDAKRFPTQVRIRSLEEQIEGQKNILSLSLSTGDFMRIEFYEKDNKIYHLVLVHPTLSGIEELDEKTRLSK